VMTQQPARCHYDRTHGQRVTRRHLDDCPDPGTCDGCQPCTTGHCSVCKREHLDDAHPNTCPACVSSIREDIDEIPKLCERLRDQAVNAESYSWASARIPGHEAMVAIGPTTSPQDVRFDRDYAETHRRGDTIPPLAVLASWEDRWREWFGQPERMAASIRASVLYLDEHLTLIAQTTMRLDDTGAVAVPPEFPEMAHDLGRLRAELEHVLHNEQAPERGVECFECGDRLVRRYRDPKHCSHETEARNWFATLLTYPELKVRPSELAAARLPCARCNQGGIDDPTPGVSWECPGCRMVYTPGQYATAVRRDLLDSGEAEGWTDITLAADAASTLTGHPVPATTVRKWMDRGLVASMCSWRPGQVWGQRLVFWPDVAERATAAGVRRAS
jgi:hypothetical protein